MDVLSGHELCHVRPPRCWKDLPLKKRRYGSEVEYQKKQQTYMTELVESWLRVDGLATKMANKKCRCPSSEDDQNMNKKRKTSDKMECGPVMSDKVTEQIFKEQFITMDVLPNHDSVGERVDQSPRWKDLPMKKRTLSNYQKMQEKYMMKLMGEYPGENGLATKIAIKRCPWSSSDDDENKKKKRKISNKMECGPVVRNEVTKRLKEFITGDQINGSEMTLVIQKVLYKSDLKADQNRLNLPFKQLETQRFLTAEEKRDLEDNKAIEVQLVGPTLQMYDEPMTLKIWSMSKTKNYVLKTKWKQFVADNNKDLKESSKIQLWSFRKDQQLCFAIVVVETSDVMINKVYW